jgi:hypothetical protein
MNQQKGPGENVFTSSEKIVWFKRKLKLWKNHIVAKSLEMFSLLLRLRSEERYRQVPSLIENRLEELWNKIKHYFPSISQQVYDWLRDPYSESSDQPETN